MTFIKISITLVISGAYIVMPIDIIADCAPFVGTIDDASIGTLASIMSYRMGKKATIAKKIKNALEDVAEAIDDLEDDVEDVKRKLD